MRTALAPTYPATSRTPLRMKGRGLHLREERNSWLLELGFSRFMASSEVLDGRSGLQRRCQPGASGVAGGWRGGGRRPIAPEATPLSACRAGCNGACSGCPPRCSVDSTGRERHERLGELSCPGPLVELLL